VIAITCARDFGAAEGRPAVSGGLIQPWRQYETGDYLSLGGMRMLISKSDNNHINAVTNPWIMLRSAMPVRRLDAANA
jgi:hypothetical protein